MNFQFQSLFLLVLLLCSVCHVAYVLVGDVQKYANKTLTRSCSISISVDLAPPTYITVPANATPWDFIVNNMCKNHKKESEKSICIERGLTLVISAALGETSGFVDIENGFGELVSKNTISKINGYGFDTNELRALTLITNEGLFFDDERKEFYSRGYCAPQYNCPLSIPEISLVEIPRCGSSILKKWITRTENEYFKRTLHLNVGVENMVDLNLNDTTSTLLSDTVFKGHYPFTKMICCKYAARRVKVASIRNPFDRAISIFEHFFLNNNYLDHSKRGALPLDKKRQDYIFIMDDEGGYTGLMELSDLDSYITLSTQYDDTTCDGHAISQCSMLIEKFVALRAPILDTEYSPLSIDAFKTWMADLYIVHAESLYWDMEQLFRSLCEEYSVTTLCKPNNDDKGNSNDAFNVFDTLKMVQYNYTSRIHPLLNESIQALVSRYECDFIAFGYSTSYYIRENPIISNRIQRIDDVIECLGRHGLLSHYAISF